MDLRNATIAIATDNGTTVSSHFSRARYYAVIYLVDGKVIGRERREKAVYHLFASQKTGRNQGNDRGASQARGRGAVSFPITDCQAVIVHSMCRRTFDYLSEVSVVPVLTNLHTIQEVIGAIAAGSVHQNARWARQHQHGQR